MSTPAAPARHPNEILAVLLLAGVSFALSQTMVLPALPQLAADLDATASSASWVLTAYLLSASVATPLVGKLGDLFGKRRLLTAVLVAFAAGSTICAVSTSLEAMVAGRVIQGVAGGIFPLAFGVIRDTFPRERVAGGIGLISAVFGIGGGIGLPLSGVLVGTFHTSAIFWFGLVALPAALAANRVIPESPRLERTRIDWLGAVLLSTALVSVLYGVTNAPDWGWGAPATLAWIAFGLTVGAAWVAFERRQPEPLVDIRLMQRRAVAATNLAALFIGFALFASFLLIPQFAQAAESSGYGFGMSVTESGLLLVPSSILMLVAGPIAGRVGARHGFRVSLMIGTLFSAAAFGWLAVEHASPWQFVVSGALLGIGVGFSFSAMANLIVAAVPQSQVGIATGMNTISRLVGGAFGSGAAAAILAAQTIGSSALPAVGGYTAAFGMSAAVGLLAFAAAALVPPLRAVPATTPAAA